MDPECRLDLEPPEEAGALDVYDPANVSPVIGWLAGPNCPATAQVFHVIGDRLFVMQMPAVAARLSREMISRLERRDERILALLERPTTCAGLLPGLFREAGEPALLPQQTRTRFKASCKGQFGKWYELGARVQPNSMRGAAEAEDEHSVCCYSLFRYRINHCDCGGYIRKSAS